MKITIQMLLFAAFLIATAGCDGNTFSFSNESVQENDGEYTIMLKAFSTPEHVTQAIHYKTETEKDTGWKGLFIVHEANYSMLYWGKYRTPEDAQKNLKKAKEYIAPAKIPIYKQALIIPIPGKEVGPPAWNLNNVLGEYSIAVAVFYDVPEANYMGRKQFAVDYCQQLRNEGYEAYYHHGLSRSTVSVGAFPDSAVEEIVKDNKITDLKILDPRITEIMKKFEFLAVNGRQEMIKMKDPNTDKIITSPAKSYIIRIPKKETDENGPDPRTYNIKL